MLNVVCFGDPHICEWRLALHSLTALVTHGVAIHSRGEYNKDIGSMPLLLCGGRSLRGGLSMTEADTKCTVLFIVRRHTPARCK